MEDYQDLIDSMNKLADWVEKENHVQCSSSPRKAAQTIIKLSEENEILKLRLGYGRKTLSDWLYHFRNMFFYGVYLLKKKLAFSRKKK
jgi:hypothetical protein